MRRFAQMVVAALVALSVAACAATTEQKQHSYRSVKCPACAYEFDVPAKN